MENLVNIITSNTIYMVLAVIIVIAIILSLIKKFFKLLVTACLILGLYVAYLAFTGQSIPITKKEIIRHGSVQFEKIKNTGLEAIDKTTVIKE